MKRFTLFAIILIPFFMLINIKARAGSVTNQHNDTAGDTTAVNADGMRAPDDSYDNNNIKPDDLQIEEPEKIEKPGTDAVQENNRGKTRKNNLAFFDPSGREYVALFIGYGGYFPVADYGNVYYPGHLVSFNAGIYYINFLGLSPEIHVRYASMNYKEDPFRYRATLSQVQVYPAIVYRYPIRLPRNTLTVYGRIWDGLTVVHYKSRDPYFPVVTRNITENLNVFGLSAGCYYDVWRGLLVGIDFSYSMVSTAQKPLQAVSLMVNVGWRII